MTSRDTAQADPPPPPEHGGEVLLDVLCVGHACYDLVFLVPHHPAADEKIFADGFISCGGGPAANAAVTVARLGFKAAFAGYLGNDPYGDWHWQELAEAGVETRFILRGQAPTPVSAVLVKPEGARALVNYKGETRALPENAIDFLAAKPKVILLDGHEAPLSIPLVERARAKGISSVLDAGSLHAGTERLMGRVDYLVASEKFARQYLGRQDVEAALDRLAEIAPVALITLGERGLVWKRGDVCGALAAFPVEVADTTGAGDTFHGAFAAALADGMDWPSTLRYASAAGALCCTEAGARLGIPTGAAVRALLQRHQNLS